MGVFSKPLSEQFSPMFLLSWLNQPSDNRDLRVIRMAALEILSEGRYQQGKIDDTIRHDWNYSHGMKTASLRFAAADQPDGKKVVGYGLYIDDKQGKCLTATEVQYYNSDGIAQTQPSLEYTVRDNKIIPRIERLICRLGPRGPGLIAVGFG